MGMALAKDPTRLSLAVFVSGRGSILKSLWATVPKQIHLVVSSKPSALGLKRAKLWNIPPLVLDPKPSWDQLLEELNKKSINCLFLAGFMKILPSDFIKNWGKPILNVHPSLLPKYPGLRAIERSYQDLSDMGVTVHEVNAELDGGPIVMQRKVIDASQVHLHTLAQAEMKIHLAEQSLVQGVIRHWMRV